MKYYLLVKEYSYPNDEKGYLPVDVIEEDDNPQEEAKSVCEEEALYVKENLNVDVTIIATATGYAFNQDDIHFRCEIIPRNTDF